MPFAELSDVRSYYEVLGTGDPVLLVPGLGTTCALWNGVTHELSESLSLILFDNRGMGRSEPKRQALTVADLAVDLVELLDHLQLERAHVVGLSLGGIIAQRLAIDHPSRVDRLVLISCTHRFTPYLREVTRLLGQALRRFPPELFHRTVELLGTSPQYLDHHVDEIDRRITLACQQGISRSAVARQLRCLACSELAPESEYRILAPTLVVAGDQDMLIPSCYAQQMARDIPGSEFLLLPGCGHNPLIEQPDVIVPRMIEFLTRAQPRHDERNKVVHSVTEVLV